MIIKRTADGEIAIILTQQEIQEMNTLLSTPTLFPTETIVDKEHEAMKGREVKTRYFLKALREQFSHTPFTYDDYQFRRLRVEHEIWDPFQIFRTLAEKDLVKLEIENGRIKTITLNWF
jgi:hypothetical protein